MLNYDLSPLLRQWIGFDKLASNILDNQESASFPLYNIERDGENHYRIVLALAGFDPDDISVELEGQYLNIRGVPSPAREGVTYLHRGLIPQKFSLSFTLADHMSVEQASYVNGLLSIGLQKQIPESLKPRNIRIVQGDDGQKKIGGERRS